MKILAFDTSSTALSVALLEDEHMVAELTLTVKKNHSISLMPVIDFLVDQAGWEPADLDRIVVAKGPGSYTGVRIAVATAKTLAYSLGIDLVGLSSLLALADLETEGVLIPIMDARRNNVYAGIYDAKKQAVMPEQHIAMESLLDTAKAYPDVTFVGEVSPFKDQIMAALPEAKVWSTLPSASLLGRIGASQTPEEIDTFVPNYLKRVEAEENWLKTHEETDPERYIKRV